MAERESALYQSSKVRVGEWWETRAWTEQTDGTKAAVSDGARPFGARQNLSAEEIRARSIGHSTADLTSWGHGDRFSRPAGPLQPGVVYPNDDRLSRRGRCCSPYRPLG